MTVREFSFAGRVHDTAPVVLARRAELPDGMVRVETTPEKVWFAADPGRFDFTEEGHIGTFLVDAQEVTNREYKRFVDAGGYQGRSTGKSRSSETGRHFPGTGRWRIFRDTTGRPGPAGWELGTYPKGKDDYPVTGVSWYEAAAYAAFVGKRLPSVYHWAVASSSPGRRRFRSLARTSAVPWLRSGVTAAVSTTGDSTTSQATRGSGAATPRETSVSPSAGRATGRRTCSGTRRQIRRLDRNPTTGFRCVKPVTVDPQEARLDAPIAKKAPIDLEREKPFSEEGWNTWKNLLSYAKGPLDARVEWTDDSLPSWRMEKVSFAAAYANERVVAYLFLPSNVRPPWQVVVFWPGAYAALVDSSQDGRNTLDGSYWDYLVQDGRAVLYPILKGTFREVDAWTAWWTPPWATASSRRRTSSDPSTIWRRDPTFRKTESATWVLAGVASRVPSSAPSRSASRWRCSWEAGFTTVS